MSKVKLFFFAVLFLFVIWAVWPQDTSPNTESESYWKERCLKCEEVLISVYSNLTGSEETLQSIESLLNSSEEITVSLLTKLNLSDEEIQTASEALKSILNSTQEPDQKVHKAWRTTAIGEALLIIGMIIVLIIL